MKYAWLLALLLSLILGTAVGELSRKASYRWVDSSDASDRIVGDANMELRCRGGACLVCFEPRAIPEMRDSLCTSSAGMAIIQPFSASAVTAVVLLGFWLLIGRRGHGHRHPGEPS